LQGSLSEKSAILRSAAFSHERICEALILGDTWGAWRMIKTSRLTSVVASGIHGGDLGVFAELNRTVRLKSPTTAVHRHKTKRTRAGWRISKLQYGCLPANECASPAVTWTSQPELKGRIDEYRMVFDAKLSIRGNVSVILVRRRRLYISMIAPSKISNIQSAIRKQLSDISRASLVMPIKGELKAAELGTRRPQLNLLGFASSDISHYKKKTS
jgi:hypothetical protein